MLVTYDKHFCEFCYASYNNSAGLNKHLKYKHSSEFQYLLSKYFDMATKIDDQNLTTASLLARCTHIMSMKRPAVQTWSVRFQSAVDIQWTYIDPVKVHISIVCPTSDPRKKNWTDGSLDINLLSVKVIISIGYTHFDRQ